MIGEWEEAERYVNANGWRVEDLYPDTKFPLALPGHEISRPYAFLDWLWLDKSKENSHTCRYLSYKRPNVTTGQEFLERQKGLIRYVNRWKNKGYLKTDYELDHYQEALIEGSGDGAAEIDHVHPKSAHGPRLFSNARVASWQFNNSYQAKPSEEKFRTQGAKRGRDWEAKDKNTSPSKKSRHF
jgi:5-methylcytosine-specific restriction endonuclease McrA